MTGDAPSFTGAEVAVIGMGGRFPGAPDLDAYWDVIHSGEERIARLSQEQCRAGGVTSDLFANPRYVPAAGLLDEYDAFDNRFFGYSNAESELMDPQHRVFLEVCWSALEDAGHCNDAARVRTGVFGGSGLSQYLLDIHSQLDLGASLTGLNVFLGNDSNFLVTKVAYKLGLRGPSVVVQSACSTSLVAVHLACQSLLVGDCDMALAGGVSIEIPHSAGYLYEEGGIMSPDGHCRPFDVDAGGTVGGSGVGVVVLRRLDDAVRDADNIRAIIRGSAVNNDGSSRVGYTAPGLDGQVGVIDDALRLSGTSPDQVSYVETHGTGTRLGDSIEFEALRAALDASGGAPCALGSVKANIGHLGEAAGVAGMIKTILCLEKRVLPPLANFSRAHPDLPVGGSRFVFPSTAGAWEPGSALVAGVSSFGMGGTNAHVILQEANTTPPRTVPRNPCVFPVSAKTPEALAAASARLRDFVNGLGGSELSDLAFTLQVGRNEFHWRRVELASDAASLARRLSDDDSVEARPHMPVLVSLAIVPPSAADGVSLFDQALEVVRNLPLGAAAYLGTGVGAFVAAVEAGVIEASPAQREIAGGSADLDRAFFRSLPDREPELALHVSRASADASLREVAEWMHSHEAARLDIANGEGSRLDDILGAPAASIRCPGADATVERADMLAAVAGLWALGADVDWRKTADPDRRRMSAPTYPFQRTRHYLETGRRAVRGDEGFSRARDGARPRRSLDGRQLREVVTQTWAEVLGAPPPEPDADFFACGGTSLAFATLISRLQTTIDSPIASEVLTSTVSVESLATLLSDAALPRAAPEDPYEVLRKDAVLGDLTTGAGVGPQILDEGPVLLTGATGFVGSAVLSALLAETDSSIHCLVRTKSERGAMRRIGAAVGRLGVDVARYGDRIRVVPGDLAKERLGMSTASYEDLAGAVAAIYHVGASVNFSLPYGVLRAANVEGTRSAIDLAVSGRTKRLFYMSTLAVFPPTAQLLLEEDLPADPKGLDTGYAQSKWVAERLVAQAIDQGVPGIIFRPGIVAGDSRTGACSTNDMLWRVMKVCSELSAVPEGGDVLYSAPVDLVGRAVACFAADPAALGRTFHLTQPHPLLWADIIAALRSVGYEVRVVPYEEWRRAVLDDMDERGESNALYGLRWLYEDGAASWEASEHVSVRATLRQSARTDLDWLLPHRDVLGKSLSYLLGEGWLDPEGPVPVDA